MRTDEENTVPRVAVEAGLVLVDGGEGCSLTLSPEAATDFEAQLGAATVVALAQRAAG